MFLCLPSVTRPATRGFIVIASIEAIVHLIISFKMPADFTSGWLGNGEQAWHGEGVVTEGTLPAREAFETANALFTVEKRPLSYPIYNDAGQESPMSAGSYGLIRTDTQQLLGLVSR